MTDAVIAEVERYRSYGWDWGVIVALINHRFGLSFTAKTLKNAYLEAEPPVASC